MSLLTCDADLYQAAADLSATAGDIAANLGEGRACPGLIAHARDMLDTLAADLGDTPEPIPPPRGWLPSRVLAYARARHAFNANDIEEYESGVRWDTPEFLRLNRAVGDAAHGVPGWVQVVADWLSVRRLHYWDHIPAAYDAGADDLPLPVSLTPAAIAALAENRTQLALFDAEPYRAAAPAPAESDLSTEEAIGVLFAERHHLGPDALRSLQGIWDCASAARYGEPYEAWDSDPAFYADHDTAECEQDD